MREVDEEGFAVRPNKSAQKREMAAIRKLVVSLLECGEGEWARMGLDADLQEGLRLARGMKASGARNRQIKFLVRRLQQNGLEAARAWMERRDLLQAEERRRFHQVERWRDRLVEEGDSALGEFLDAHPGADRQRLRALVRAARKELREQKRTGAGRKLFRLLREISSDGAGSATLKG